MKKVIVNGPLEENCYIIKRNNLCFIVDPGSEKEVIREVIEKEGLKDEGILLTHSHYDHIGALDCFKVPVYIHELEKDIIFEHYYEIEKRYGIQPSYKLDDINLKYIKDGDIIKLGEFEVEAIYTPGHTIGCTCYKIENEMYTGDTLFRETVGRWDLRTGEKETLKVSIKKLIEEYKEGVEVFPGHGCSTTIGYERVNNPFYISECN